MVVGLPPAKWPPTDGAIPPQRLPWKSQPCVKGGSDLKSGQFGRVVGAVCLLLAAVAGSGWAQERTVGASVLRTEWSPVWGSLYQMRLQVSVDRGEIAAAQYRTGAESGPLFAADGLLDSGAEELETYLEADGGPVAVRVLAAGVWSRWLEVGEQPGGAERQSACALRSAGAGARDWFRAAVTVDCGDRMEAEGAERLEYSIGFTDWTEAERAFTIDAEGVYWVQVRGLKADGTPGAVQTFQVAIDRTAPQVWLQPPPAGGLSHAEQWVAAFGAEDARSGVDLLYMELDGEQELSAGMPVDLWELEPGVHSLSVVATDHAGNRTELEEPVPLVIRVDIATLAKLVQRFAAMGRLDGYSGLKQRLIGLLAQAEAALQEGDTAGEAAALSAFAEAVQDGEAAGLLFEQASRVLAADAVWLVARLGPDPGEVAPPF